MLGDFVFRTATIALLASLVLSLGGSQARADVAPSPEPSPTIAATAQASAMPALSPDASPDASPIPIVSAPATTSPAAPLPFVPPPTWTKFPIASFVHPIANWTASDASAFSVNVVPLAFPVALMGPIVKQQLQNLGTVENVPSVVTVCGKPALRFVVKMNGSGYVMTQQTQAFGSAMYTSSYVRPSDSAPNADIVKTLQTFCGPQSVSAGPPVGWRNSDAKITGMWMTPVASVGAASFQIITLLSYDVDPDAKRLVQSAAASAFRGSRFLLLSTSRGTLCGNSATFMSGRAKIPNQAEYDMTMEVTQSATQSFVLIYGHPTKTAVSKEALASLKTLCAR